MESTRVQQLIFFGCFDIPAFVFHSSMLVFILRQMKVKPKVYFQGFYILYSAVSFVDLYYLVSTAVTFRPAIVGFFVDRYLAWGIGAKIFYESQNFCVWFQVSAHTVIAFNRFTAFFFEKLYDRMWHGRSMAVILVMLFLSPIPGFFTCLTASAHYVVFSTGKFMAAYDDRSVDAATKIATLCYYVPLSTLAFLLNICTFVRYRHIRQSSMVRNRRHEHDVRLLIHTIFMLCIQLLRMIYYLTMVGNVVPSGTPFNLFGSYAASVIGFRFAIADAYSLLGSVFLFALSPTVRSDYLAFYGMRRTKTGPARTTTPVGPENAWVTPAA